LVCFYNIVYYYRKYDTNNDTVNTVKSSQQNNPKLVYKINIKHEQNKHNLQYKNSISKVCSLEMDKKKKIQVMNVYSNAIELLQINNKKLNSQTEFNIYNLSYDGGDTSSKWVIN